MHPPHSEKIIKEFDWSHLYGHPFLQIVESWINLTIAELFLRADFMAASGEFIGTVAFLLVGLGGIQFHGAQYSGTYTLDRISYHNSLPSEIGSLDVYFDINGFESIVFRLDFFSRYRCCVQPVSLPFVCYCQRIFSAFVDGGDHAHALHPVRGRATISLTG
ncbi:hypothetical protein VP01_387g2 [Puccinia sorghi]|uniref:Uncharacterized protein n=1 Tax=Puccinia sorghi TaxID=27349 RepID=A0A0L6UTP6_9BASI|nr:hypothetical protein VP01_387g2 [Puccinia sorghi]